MFEFICLYWVTCGTFDPFVCIQPLVLCLSNPLASIYTLAPLCWVFSRSDDRKWAAFYKFLTFTAAASVTLHPIVEVFAVRCALMCASSFLFHYLMVITLVYLAVTILINALNK